jgi:hypothetical protein
LSLCREALKRHLLLSEQNGEALGKELELSRREVEALRRDRDDAESQVTKVSRLEITIF